MAFSDLVRLRTLMKEQQMAVYSIRFTYNNVNTFIAICLLTEEEKNTSDYHYALVRCRIMYQDDLKNCIECPANKRGLMISHGLLRRFFNIAFDLNGSGNWYKDLTKKIGDTIQPIIFLQDNSQIKANIFTICEHEGYNSNRIYPHHILRHIPDENNKCKHRTEYNSQLARIQFPTVFPILCNDTTISFAFTDKEENQVNERIAYEHFVENERKRLSKHH